MFLLLPGVPVAELENSQARLFDGSFASAVRAGGDGHQTRLGETVADRFATFALKEKATGNRPSSCGGVRAAGTALASFTSSV